MGSELLERLQKILSKAGVASRREAERMIIAGRITVDGKVAQLGDQADTATHVIAVDGQPIQAAQAKVYFLLNKPKGYLCTVKDNRGRKTVIDLLPDVKEYIYPVGRLDYDTSGLLLLTNDGELMNGLLHPRYEINKTYIAKVKGIPTEDKLKQLRKGVMLEDGVTASADVRSLEQGKDWSTLQLVIHEGRNRQVRRMTASVGHEVIALKRTAFAGLNLEGVKRGHYRALTSDEINRLKDLYR